MKKHLILSKSNRFINFNLKPQSFLLFIFLLLITSSCSSTITWKKNQKLTWADFKQKTLTKLQREKEAQNEKETQMQRTAHIYTGIRLVLHYTYWPKDHSSLRPADSIEDVSVRIKAVMDPEKSWVRKSVKNDYFPPNSKRLSMESRAVLRHEQLHFDITEIFARKMRKKVTEKFKTLRVLKVNALNSFLSHLCETISKERRAMQKKYDKETYAADKDNNPNSLRKKQKEWETKVAILLKIYEQFSKKTIFKGF